VPLHGTVCEGYAEVQLLHLGQIVPPHAPLGLQWS
jgi:hypothetical protein